MCQLYIGSRDSCGYKLRGGYFSENSFDTIKNISYIESSSNDTSAFSSKPFKVCLCGNNGINCSADIQLETITGKAIFIQVVTVGQYNDVTPSSVGISLEENIQIRTTQQTQETKKKCTQLKYRPFSNAKTATFALYPETKGGTSCRMETQINVTFHPCPDGFLLDQEEMQCVCHYSLQRYTKECNIDTNSIVRQSNSFWMGAVYGNNTFEGFILHSGCPFDYCVTTPVLVQLDNLDVQCNYNHSGTLCGSCKHNHSLAFGTLHCIPCSNIYITLILPFSLAGVILVVSLLLSNMSVANGMINGLIFYANIIQANRSAFFPSKEHSDVLIVFIAWINLDLGIESCFYDGMTIYAFTWLQFLFPFYVWFLIVLIITPRACAGVK